MTIQKLNDMLKLEILRQQNNIVAMAKPSRSQVTSFSNNTNSLLPPQNIISAFYTRQIHISA